MNTTAGFSLVEVIVAMLIMAIVALGVAQTVIVSQQGRKTSAAWMRATQLAAEQLERVRAGSSDAGTEILGSFTRTWRSEAVAGYPDLRRVEVAIAWADRKPQQYELAALIPIRPD